MQKISLKRKKKELFQTNSLIFYFNSLEKRGVSQTQRKQKKRNNKD